MRRLFTSFVWGGVLGIAAGFAVGILVTRFIFPAPPAIDALIAANERVIARGTFIQADPDDPIHYGKGKVTVHAKVLRLEQDFAVGPGPKFHVYLVPKATIRNSADVKETMYVDLGRLRAFMGAQNYRIPDGVDLTKYTSVVIWSEASGVLVS
ncbi:MAG: DM13 domain-containing protein, partial [Alphaproteobacteria bacterium]|nr:DM13 domain-containing protein [Alphaproteobacteria bacterium]